MAQTAQPAISVMTQYNEAAEQDISRCDDNQPANATYPVVTMAYNADNQRVEKQA